jgi:hypothetical protein
MEHINAGLTIIENRIDLINKIICNYDKCALPSIPDQINLIESYVHDIQDCIYWIKNEREKNE